MILIFDLDGTISDPSAGITASINYALDRLGSTRKPESILTKYIGPSLVDIFSDLLNTQEKDLINAGISFFRERYKVVGYKENVLYPGMDDILQLLNEALGKLYIATTKKPDIARMVTDYFGISGYFKGILGCGIQRNKVELIEEIREKENTHNMIMIGDRFIDMIAGRKTGCICAGVLWGYGSYAELKKAGADLLLRSPTELLELLSFSKAGRRRYFRSFSHSVQCRPQRRRKGNICLSKR